ncbi:SRPBCC family protein [Occallatibacter riparius]|uniref:SRPBCC domain-containing protein n=1 Tax=Occallatibacter riparius TaxID=1002689 RepID=A0A9J7BQ60_9BACT|nr:SRPBCC domain-containing protein [Occallatibacter riparius]UWZ84689.1 SRPBCC domain-containing protein [Occallatibacter riparius]
MIATAPGIEDLTLNITQEIHVNAPLEATFAALIEQLTTASEHPDGTPMPMKLELRPGGRWFRDLGGDNGHFWATVQALKQPALIEFAGPLFMSYPVVNNVQYRLSEVPGGTLIKFTHSAFGLIPEEHKKGVTTGWNHTHEQARLRAERNASR